ncbi:MAG: hypothetical protein ACPKMZ_05365 [Pleomorphochaeta sp.]
MLNLLKYYIINNIDEKFTITPYKNKSKLPLYLKNKFNFYNICILNIECILAENITEPLSINGIKKYITLLQEFTSKEIVFYFNQLTPYRRKSLINNRVNFIEENGQFFLPFLGLLLKTNLTKSESVMQNNNKFISLKKKKFSSIEQFAYLFFLYNKIIEISNKDFATLFNISEMSASRALKSLYLKKLITYKIEGQTSRMKSYKRIDDPLYYNMGKDFLINPIKKIVYVTTIPENSYICGLEALSELSMISPSRNKQRAISYVNFINQNIEVINNEDIINDNNYIKLELWKYDPSYFIKNGIVDTLSLYFTLIDNKDERIDKELENLLREESWYTE